MQSGVINIVIVMKQSYLVVRDKWMMIIHEWISMIKMEFGNDVFDYVQV